MRTTNFSLLPSLQKHQEFMSNYEATLKNMRPIKNLKLYLRFWQVQSWWQILRLGYMANKYLKDGWYDNLFRTSAIIPSVYNLQKMYWGDIEWRGYWRTASIELDTCFCYWNIFWQISVVPPVLEFSSESSPRNTRSHTRSPRFYGPRNNTHRRLKSTEIERMIW